MACGTCFRAPTFVLDGLVLCSGGLDVPSVGGGDISGDLPSIDAELTGPDVDVEGGGGVSLGAGLAAGATAAVGAAAVGLGLSGKADKPEGEVRRVFVFCAYLCSCFVLGVAVYIMNRFRTRPRFLETKLPCGFCRRHKRTWFIFPLR